jgi:hypothetical protein
MNSPKQNWLRKFLSVPQARLDKPPLQPKQAIIISIIAVIVIPIGGILFHILLLTSLILTIFWSALVLYFALGISWSFVRWDTRNISIRGHNAFVIFAVILFCVVMIISKDYEPFPKWAIAALIIGGTCGYSMMGICAVRNFLKWRKGILYNN